MFKLKIVDLLPETIQIVHSVPFGCYGMFILSLLCGLDRHLRC